MAEDERDECLAYFNHQTFGISVALSFTVFLEKLVNAQQRQGLTLVYFSGQLKRFLWDRGCIQGLLRVWPVGVRGY